jgi:ATP dependent DNA ligase domain
VIVRRPSGFIKPSLPSKVARPPSGPLWVHEIKHDGYRLMVRRDGQRVRCFTPNGTNWADRFPSIVEAAARLEAHSFLIDGEVVIARDDGSPDFHTLRTRRTGHAVVLYAPWLTASRLESGRREWLSPMPEPRRRFGPSTAVPSFIVSASLIKRQ